MGEYARSYGINTSEYGARKEGVKDDERISCSLHCSCL